MDKKKKAVEVPTCSTVQGPLEQRVKEASEVMLVEEKSVWDSLNKLGIKKEHKDAVRILDSNTSTVEDFLNTIPDSKNNLARVKLGWAILTGKMINNTDNKNRDNSLSSTLQEFGKSLRPIEQWGDKELVSNYGPECESRITDELQKRSKGNSVIIFNNDGSVCIEATTDMIRASRRGKTPDTYLVEGVLKRVCKVGEFPTVMVEECPLHEDTILVNGYCDKCKDTWNGIKEEEMVALRVALISHNIRVPIPSESSEIIRKAKSGQSILDVPSVKMEFEELKSDNSLPILKRRISKDSRGSDPFFVHKTY